LIFTIFQLEFILQYLFFSVEVVKQQLDVENLGIITKTAFLNEFYPGNV
jgi:hypothetical protein